MVSNTISSHLMVRYLVYIRVSTNKQEDSGLGIDAQRHACSEYIRQAGGELYHEFLDVVSGTDRKRKELEQRPQLVEALSTLKRDDILIVAKRDRLGRDPYLNCMVERMVEKRQAKLISANGDMEGDEPHQLLMRRIIDAFAEYEALMISTRTKAALARKKARGERVGHIPYGYKQNRGGQIVVNNQEARVLERMYAYRLQGMTLREIASELNNQGLINRHGDWTHGAISRVWRNYESFSSANQEDHRKSQVETL